MATGDSPAGARRRVRLAVREAREEKGLTQAAVADEMDWSLSKLVRIELGEVTITPNDLRPLLGFLGITDPARVESLIQDSRASRRRKMWWDESGFKDALTPAMRQFIQYEAEATEYRSFTVLVPAPLQTREYAEALFHHYTGELSDDIVRGRIDQRTRRREELLRRADSVRIHVLLDEVALRRRLVPKDVMAGQLVELLRLADLKNILVRVLHFEADVPPSLFGAFEILTLPASDDNEILYRESGLSDELVEDRAEVARHRDIYDLRWENALDDSASRQKIEETIKALDAGDAGGASGSTGRTGRQGSGSQIRRTTR
jgi:transcriptional regulator with XRE-family HTH domain